MDCWILIYQAVTVAVLASEPADLRRKRDRKPKVKEKCEGTQVTTTGECESMCEFTANLTHDNILTLGSKGYPLFQSIGDHCLCDFSIPSGSDGEIQIIDFMVQEDEEDEVCGHQVLISMSPPDLHHRELKDFHMFCPGHSMDFTPWSFSATTPSKFTLHYKNVVQDNKPVIILISVHSNKHLGEVHCRSLKKLNTTSEYETTTEFMPSSTGTEDLNGEDLTSTVNTVTNSTNASFTSSVPSETVTTSLPPLDLNAIPYWWVGVVLILTLLLVATLYILITSNRRKKKKQREVVARPSSDPNPYTDVINSLRQSNHPDYEALQNQYRALHGYLALHGYQGLDLPHGYQDINRPNSYEDIYEQLGAYQRLRHGHSARHAYQLLQQYVSEMSSQIYIQQVASLISENNPVIQSEHEPNVSFSRSGSGDSGVHDTYIPPSLPEMSPPPIPPPDTSASYDSEVRTVSASIRSETFGCDPPNNNENRSSGTSSYLEPSALPEQSYLHPGHRQKGPDGNVILPPRYEFFYPHEFSQTGISSIKTDSSTKSNVTQNSADSVVNTSENLPTISSGVAYKYEDISVASRVAQYSAEIKKKTYTKKQNTAKKNSKKEITPPSPCLPGTGNDVFSRAVVFHSNYLHAHSSTSDPNKTKYLSLRGHTKSSPPSSGNSSGYSSAYPSILNLSGAPNSTSSDQDTDLDDNDLNNDSDHEDSAFTNKPQLITVQSRYLHNKNATNKDAKLNLLKVKVNRSMPNISSDDMKEVPLKYLHPGMLRSDSGFDEEESEASGSNSNPYLEILPEEITLNPAFIQTS